MSNGNMLEAKMNDLLRGRELKMDDSFQFECTGCGRCCYGHDDIILTGADIFRIAKKLKISTLDVINNYTDIQIGHDSKMPVAMMGQRFDGSCPFLSLGKCMVHDHKPVTCAFFPVGRIIRTDTREIRYFLQEKDPRSQCKHGDKTYTLREWLEGFNLLGSDEDTFAWTDGITDLSNSKAITWYRENYDKLEQRTREIIFDISAGALYLKYDLDKPYAEQVKSNVQEIIMILDIAFDKSFK